MEAHDPAPMLPDPRAVLPTVRPPDRQRVRDRDAGGVGERDVEVGETVPGRPGGDLAVEPDVRPALRAADDLDVGPAHPLSDAGAEGLQHGLLGGEAGGQVLVALRRLPRQ